MIFSWPSFQIDLESFNKFLKTDISDADGIVANESELNIIEKNPLSQNEIDSINNYYNSLTEVGEQQKITDRENSSLNLPNYASNNVAKTAGLDIGDIYQTNGVLKIVY